MGFHYNIGIIGVGVVGSSLVNYFQVKTDHTLFLYDPAKGHKDNLKDVDIVFISVPVPCKGWHQNLEFIKESILRVPPLVPIIIRSTILPGTCELLTEEFNRPICHMPEFLTARRANEDMLNTKQVYLGIPAREKDLVSFSIVAEIFRHKIVIPMKSGEAEMLKYAHNLHAAVKITFWNGIADLCERNDFDFEKIRINAINATGFINEEHTRVPGPDGEKGFGGTCFPVNLENFIGYANTENQLFSKFLQDVYCLNRIYRGLKKSENSNSL